MIDFGGDNYISIMKDFSDDLKPAAPDGATVLSKQRQESKLPTNELAQHLFDRNNFLPRQQRVLKILESEPIFRKQKQQNLSRPERYHLGLARAKTIRRLSIKHKWDAEDDKIAEWVTHLFSSLIGTHINLLQISLRRCKPLYAASIHVHHHCEGTGR